MTGTSYLFRGGSEISNLSSQMLGTSRSPALVGHSQSFPDRVPCIQTPLFINVRSPNSAHLQNHLIKTPLSLASTTTSPTPTRSSSFLIIIISEAGTMLRVKLQMQMSYVRSRRPMTMQKTAVANRKADAVMRKAQTARPSSKARNSPDHMRVESRVRKTGKDS
jgi:hypothetical protein